MQTTPIISSYKNSCSQKLCRSENLFLKHFASLWFEPARQTSEYITFEA